jgi:N-acetylmuramoyl-L-alanine amidase
VLVTAVRRHLAATGAEVIPLLHRDGSQQAAAANAAGVEAYIGLRLDPEQARCTASYYSGFRYESAGGRRLAELLQEAAAAALGLPAGGVQGMSLPVLRETRMPAVICEVGPATVVVTRAAALAGAIVDALTQWAVAPVE